MNPRYSVITSESELEYDDGEKRRAQSETEYEATNGTSWIESDRSRWSSGRQTLDESYQTE
jgi:hypothetical protein